MGTGGFVDESELLSKGPGSEEEDHDEGVREADFGTVDSTIAGCFEEGEVVGIFRVEYDIVYGVLLVVKSIEFQHGRRANLDGIHLWDGLGDNASGARN